MLDSNLSYPLRNCKISDIHIVKFQSLLYINFTLGLMMQFNYIGGNTKCYLLDRWTMLVVCIE